MSAIILTLPLMFLIALIIRRDSPGPALFRQIRVGCKRTRRLARNGHHPCSDGDGSIGRPFTFYKFRTMHVDAREVFPELYRYRYSEEEVMTMYFKKEDDPRLTRFGRILRKTSLDELPNFINVLSGDLTMVGPRPEIPEMLPYYYGEELRKFEVKPGITGMPQSNGRGLLTFYETKKLDLWYVENRTLWLDLWIIGHTIISMVRRIGAF